MTAKEVIAEMNAADKKAPPIKREGSFYTWRKKGYEGFDPAAVDAILGLRERGLRSVVLMPLGYRDASGDWLASMGKVRKSRDTIITEVN